jgi:cytochrome c553
VKTFLKVVGGVVVVIVALIAGGLSWLSLRKPAQNPPSSEKIAATPARIARGEYVVEHVADCLGCHSDHIMAWSVPVKPGTEGQGGYIFDKKLGFPGVVAAQNITPDPTTGLGKWTDGEILRAIREGIDRNGNALFPMMPYQHFANMSDEDAKSVVAYLRTLKPIRNQVPDKHLDFPVNYIVKFIPKPLNAPVPEPDHKNSVAYGKYLARIGGCYECHAPHDDHNNLDETRAFAGGWKMDGPWGRVVTANLTPATDGFMKSATKAEFIGRFKSFASVGDTEVPKGQNTVMPWKAFAGMTEADLGAIYDYLKTVKPVTNHIVTFPDRK